MQIEEAIKELRESYELKHRQWAYNCLDVIKEELEKKDEVIDEMAEWINKQDIDEEICKNNITQPELCNEEHSNCKECIKDYFSKKVSDNK